MKYADNHSTSAQNIRIDNRTKYSNPPKQVGDNKRLCQAGGAKETENKLLLQISEADQVSDFERILNSNAILCERARGHVWRGSVAAHTPSASPRRPRSSYSLRAVSQAYHYLFRRHEESLQPLIDHYRQTLATDTHTSLANNWDSLQELQEFYEDDQALKKEIEAVSDHVISEEIQAEPEKTGKRQKNFNVNLAGLIDLHVTGEGYSPSPALELDPSPDDRPSETDDEEEWLAPSMSADDQQLLDNNSVDGLAQNLSNVKLDRDAKLPTITFSNCIDEARSDAPNNNDVVIHLAVPAIESIDETRPPMM